MKLQLLQISWGVSKWTHCSQLQLLQHYIVYELHPQQQITTAATDARRIESACCNNEQGVVRF